MAQTIISSSQSFKSSKDLLPTQFVKQFWFSGLFGWLGYVQLTNNVKESQTVIKNNSKVQQIKVINKNELINNFHTTTFVQIEKPQLSNELIYLMGVL